ncbi:MAG: MFS transporter [Bacteroides sp.]
MKHNKLFPILVGFFVMGFVDLVGIATNYVKVDFNLSDSFANILPMMVFVWFAVCSIPTGLLMDKYGKRNAVLAAMGLTLLAMILPVVAYNYPIALLTFGLLGISNTMLQVALNPMVASVVRGEQLTSILTWGQFIKAISSFLGPILVGAAALYTGNWRLVFMIYAIVTLLSALWIFLSIPATKSKTQVSTFSSTLALLRDPQITLLFIGILLIVGIDVGINTTIPKLLIEKTQMELAQAGLGSSLYFAARTGGTLVGAILLARIAGGKFLKVNMIIALAAFVGLLFIEQTQIVLALIFIIGFTCSNVFSIIFANALQHQPEKNNEISALMIMGVSGGALIAPIMGVIADQFNQTASLSVLILCVIYLLYLSARCK